MIRRMASGAVDKHSDAFTSWRLRQTYELFSPSSAATACLPYSATLSGGGSSIWRRLYFALKAYLLPSLCHMAARRSRTLQAINRCLGIVTPRVIMANSGAASYAVGAGASCSRHMARGASVAPGAASLITRDAIMRHSRRTGAAASPAFWQKTLSSISCCFSILTIGANRSAICCVAVALKRAAAYTWRTYAQLHY